MSKHDAISCNSLMTESMHVGEKSIQASTVLQFPSTKSPGAKNDDQSATEINVNNAVARLGAASTGAVAATATLTLQTADLATLDAKEITITDAEENEKTYKLQNGGSGATGDTVGEKVRVVLNSGSHNTKVKIANEIKLAITDEDNGHDDTITVAVDQASGVITLTQATKGLEGNTAIVLAPAETDFSAILVATDFIGGLDNNIHHKLVAGKYLGQILVCLLDNNAVINKNSVAHFSTAITNGSGGTVILCWTGTKWALLSKTF